MATIYKVLGQINPTANTATTVHTVPASTNTVISTVTVCNQAVTAASFSLAVRPAGEALAAKHYVSFNTSIPANDSIGLTLGITMAATDVLTANANTSTISFNAFGTEIS
jgi:hypothetical protein